MTKVFKKIYKYLLIIIIGRIGYARKIGVNIGKGCRIYIDEWGTEPYLISIGENVTITADVSIITHDGSTWLMRDQEGRRYHYAPVEIGDNVFIGKGSIILPGVKINSNVIVGAGSIVTKSVPGNVIIAGNPAKIIGDFNNYKKRCLEDYISDYDLLKLDMPYEEKIKNVSKTFKNELNLL